jgi:hypothetical protein
MAYTAYASYSIWFTNQAEYDFALAAVGGNPTTGGAFIGSPLEAAAFFGITWPGPAIGMGDKGFIFYFPYTPGAQIMHPGPTGIFLDEGIASYTVPGQQGNPPIFGQGQDLTLLWAGGIIMSNGAVNDSDDPTPIPRRRWIGGIANTPLMEGASAFAAGEATACRASARTMEGMGIPVRGANSSNWTRLVNEYITGFTTRTSWERFYFRPRVIGTGDSAFWRSNGVTSNLAGARLYWRNTGVIQANNVSNIGNETLIGASSVLALNEWYLLDVLLKYSSGGGDDGRFRLYINHVLVIDQVISDGNGLDQSQFHAGSQLGRNNSPGDNIVEYDVCDWICADIPNKLGVESLDSIDWHLGSHVVGHLCPTVTAPSFTPAAPLVINQGRYGPSVAFNSALTSTTANAQINGTTDLLDTDSGVQPVATGIAIGPVAAVIGVRSRNAGSTDGQLGYSIAGAGFVMVTINEVNTDGYNTMMYNPSGMILPTPIEPLLIRYQKSNDANSAVVTGLTVSVEYIGVWGPEDNEDVVLEFPNDFLHNARHANSFWGLAGLIPDAPVYAVGGTYAGNGTQVTVSLPAPCHYLFIRGTTVSSSPVSWFAAGLSGSHDAAERSVACFPTMIYTDPVTGLTTFTVTGSDLNINQAGVTYQYIAFCDPGCRFNYCGAYNINPLGQVGARPQLLADPTFLAEWGFVQGQEISTSIIVEFASRGPGNTANTGNEMDGGQLVNFGSFSTGIFSPNLDSFDSTNSQSNYSLWRSHDPNCGFTMMQIGTYTGNGAGGTRVIPFPEVTGRFPLFIIVQPVTNNNPPFFRDPSHTGSNSAQFNNLANSTTAIVAGAVDSFSVGVTLNANGIVYNFFIILGSNASWANGQFFPPNCLPPEIWVDPPMDPPEIAVAGDGGLELNGQVPITLLRDVSGIYTLVPGKTNDTLYDRQTGQSSVDVKIPDPFIKTGFIGG